MSCEETEAKAGAKVAADGHTVTLEKNHRCVFEVHPTDMARHRDPKPIKAFGRLASEAVVIDPITLDA